MRAPAACFRVFFLSHLTGDGGTSRGLDGLTSQYLTSQYLTSQYLTSQYLTSQRIGLTLGRIATAAHLERIARPELQQLNGVSQFISQ